MSSPEIKDDDYEEEIFSLRLDEILPDNRRIAVRYIRSDISASLIVRQKFFFFSKKIAVKLIDISSKGVAVVCKEKINVKKACLTLVFSNGHRFTINGKIIYRGPDHIYGIKFDTLNNELGNALLATQTDLIFK